MGVDPVTREVIRNRLTTIAAEMQTTLLRSAYSVILKEGEDCSAALFNQRGEIIAQSCALPQHMGAFIPALRRIIDAFGVDEMCEGDVYVMNDPHDGGTHLPDLIVAIPVFFERELVGFSVDLAHQEDFGGKVPGSMPADSTEIYQEGLIVPPLKLYDRGNPNETLLSLIRRNVRIPHVVLGDISAQVAAATVGMKGLHELHRRYGKAEALRYTDALLDHAEALTRKCIQDIPDGEYVFTDYMDNDGIDLQRRVPITATVSVAGSEITVDFAGTSPQVKGPINAPWSGAAASVFYAVRTVTDATIPDNHGCYRPLHVILPEGSLVKPRHPAPVAIRAHTLKRVADVVLGALVKALPGRLPAASSGSISVVSFGGVDPDSGKRFGVSDIIAGGTGGRSSKDGVEVMDTDVSNCMNIPVEAIEMEYPLQVVRYALREDGGGPGMFRGGTGVERVCRVTRGEVTCSYRSERHYTAPWGLFGGLPGTMWETRIVRRSGAIEHVPGKQVFTLREGDELHVYAGGGGGYGDPLQRHAERVVEDVIDRKISPERAERDYGVVVDPAGSVDVHATERVRTELRDRRGEITWSYDRGAAGKE
jgi:N-methylhydantoinase B